MYRGYVKLWRKSLDAGWLKNPNLWMFWCWCLTKASHKEHDVIVGYQSVHLMPGDFVFGRKAASEELELSERSIRTNLDFLKNHQNVTIKTTNKFSIVSIVNWHIYQSEENTNDQQNDQPPTNKRPATDHKQECKERKNEKKKIFIVPSVEEVEAYCKERKNNIDPQYFVDSYTAKGWMVGKNKMKDWKASIRTWEKNNYGGNNGQHQGYTGREHGRQPAGLQDAQDMEESKRELRAKVDSIHSDYKDAAGTTGGKPKSWGN